MEASARAAGPSCRETSSGSNARSAASSPTRARRRPPARWSRTSEGRLLLARRAHEPFKGRWDIPGGFLEEGEHPLDGLRRELREETGLEVEPVEFLGVWMDRYGGDSTAEATLNLYWTARVTGGEAAPADDVDDLRWFERHELPEAGELAFENVPLVLAAWQLHAQRSRLDR